MTAFRDLSPCTYFGIPEPHSLVAVGWLGDSFEFTTGAVTESFLDRLVELIQDPWQPPFVCAGGHDCELCHLGVQSTSTLGDRSFSSYSVQNIFVPHDGRIYVAPEGIGHYVACHRYRPPEEFITAVLDCPPVRSMAFKTLLLSCGGRALLKTPGE